MSFTQENKTNVLYCDGCEKHCKFGVKIEEDRFFPTIGGTKIDFFRDENDRTRVAGLSGYDLWREGIKESLHQKIYMLDMARKIAKVCDHYKTR